MHGLREHAPSLKTLSLVSPLFFMPRMLMSEEEVDGFVDTLTGLRQHPTLERLELLGLGFQHDMIPRLQQGLGTGIQVVVDDLTLDL